MVHYRGVSRTHPHCGRYGAKIMIEGEYFWLGTFATAEEAAREYDTAARKAFGSNAITNFPTERLNKKIKKKKKKSEGKKFDGKVIEEIVQKALASEFARIHELSLSRPLEAPEDIQKLKQELMLAKAQSDEKTKAMNELQVRLADAELQLIEAEKLRKQLHNTIMELKGNIRVFCRVRPMLPVDGAKINKKVVSYPSSLESQGRGVELLQKGKKVPFNFDKVFSDEASQKDVFVEISQLVQSALDGYKVCIFAYGESGSGKTYTMMGVPEDPDQKGLIPRSLEQIFQTSQLLSTQGWEYKMQASGLEIYKETIRDLLITNLSSGVDLSRAKNNDPGKQYNIVHDANGNTKVSQLTIIDVSNFEKASLLLRQATQSRSVGKTMMNEQSSRSHFVFTLRITGFNKITNQQVHGTLNLIDLAGSESLKRSEPTGETLKETQAINKSLSCLKRVITALSIKGCHVPVRDSKLTYLLQPCFGVDSKTLMFVNISPNPSSVQESYRSLQFAAEVNCVSCG